LLKVDGRTVARYVRHWQEDDWNDGETILEDGLKAIGKGNLLAGVLLSYWLKKEREERPFSLKEFFPEFFPSPHGKQVL
jgi:hypothetical protein